MITDIHLTKHVDKQLKLRYGTYTNQILIDAINNNPTFTVNDEYHTYLGTGFDIYGESPKKQTKIRRRIQRRHLFLVTKIDKGKTVAITALFHTNKSILKHITNKYTIVLNNGKKDENFSELHWTDASKKIAFGVKDNNPLEFRKDSIWIYDGKFIINTKYYM